MSSANGILLISPSLEDVQAHLEGRSCEVLDSRGHGILSELESLLEPTFFGPGAEAVLIHSMEQIGARQALQIVEMAPNYPETFWAFHISELNPPKRQKKFEKVLQERYPKKALRPPSISQLRDECLQNAARLGVTINHTCVELLIQWLGADRKLLQLELEKFAHLDRPVEMDDILQSYAPQGKRDLFSLPRRLLNGEKEAVLRDIRSMEPFEDVFSVANAFVHELSKIYLVKLLGSKARFTNTGISDYFIGQYRSACQQLSVEHADELMELAATVDYELKTTSLGYEQVYALIERIDLLRKTP